MNNEIHVYSSKEGKKNFIKSSIESSEKVLEHYDFVLNDISSEISDPYLEATKWPAVEFLMKMRRQWFDFKKDLENQLVKLEKK